MLSTSKTKLSLLALLSVGALAITSCKKDRGNNTIIPKPKDGGMDMDTGTGDTGTGDTGTGDTGVNDTGTNDTGVNDTGVNDAGMAECAVNGDCVAPANSCLNFDQATGSLAQCAGQNTCQCWQSCDPFVNVDQSGCPRPAEACGTAGGMSPTPGVCLPDMGGFAQGQACTSMWMGTDPTMGYQGDDCNGSQNFICNGTDPLDPVGTCARLCDTANPALCTSLDPATACVPFSPMTTRGVCINTITDLAVACQNPGECQGGHCEAAIGGQCSQQCGLSFTCGQAEGLCVFVAGQILLFCARTCPTAVTSDPECAAINPGTICENLGDAANPLNLCFPRCAMDMDCGPAPATCNTATGHCM
jgi:hypothetical protein